MKKIIGILVFVIAFTVQAQHKKQQNRKKMNFSLEQRVELAVKKMTLSFDLSESQQEKIKPLLMAKAEERKKVMEARKKAKQDQKKPSSDEIFEMKMKRMDNMIAMKNSMKEILNKEQFEKFEKMAKKRKAMAMKKMKQRKNKHKKDINQG